MSAVVEIEFDTRDQRFVLTCQGCGWVGLTSSLPVIAVPASEHVRSCDGRRHKRTTPYDADSFADIHRGRPPAEPDAPAPTGPRRQLSADQVRDIRSLAAAGSSLREIAETFDASVANIHAIVSRRSWKHI